MKQAKPVQIAFFRAMEGYYNYRKNAREAGLRSFVEYLTNPIDMIADGSALLFLIIQQVNGIKKFKFVYFTKDAEQLVIVDAITNNGKVDIGAGTISSL